MQEKERDRVLSTCGSVGDCLVCVYWSSVVVPVCAPEGNVDNGTEVLTSQRELFE